MSTVRPTLPSLNQLTNERSLPPLSALLNSTPLPPPPHQQQQRSDSLHLPQRSASASTTSIHSVSPIQSKSAPVSPVNKTIGFGLQLPEQTQQNQQPTLKTPVRLPSFSELHQLPNQSHHHQVPPPLPFPNAVGVTPVSGVVPHITIGPAPSIATIPQPIPGPQQHIMATPVKKPNDLPTRSPTSAEKRSYAFISHSPSTYPTQEPSIDNHQLARRKRRRTSPTELAILQSEFEIGTTPNRTRRLEIASKVNMTEKAVQIWFQNRRQTVRKQTSSEKEVHHLEPIFMQHQHIQQVQLQHLGHYGGSKPELHGVPLKSTFEGAKLPQEHSQEEGDKSPLVPSIPSSSSLLFTPAKTPKHHSDSTTSSILKFRLQDQPKTDSNSSCGKVLTPISEKINNRTNLPPTFKSHQTSNFQSSPLENQENRSSPLKFKDSGVKLELGQHSSPTRIPLKQKDNDEGVANLLNLRNWK